MSCAAKTDGHEPAVYLFTDGACIGNPGPGGWAYVLRTAQGMQIEMAGGEEHTTNNRMELMAVIRGLESLTDSTPVELCADSQYVVLGINEWLAGWKRRGWRKSNKQPVENVDLWQRIDELLQKRRVHAVWVRGHTGHPENERCDQIANAEAMRIQQRKQGR